MPMRVVEREATHLYTEPPGPEPHRALIDALLRLQQIENAAVERVRRRTGLNRTDFQALRYVLQGQRDNRSIGPKDLGAMLGLSNPAVTKVIDGLQRIGCIERRPHPSDRRAQLLVPTPHGERLIAEGYRDFHDRFVAAVGRQPVEGARCAAAMLEDVASRLREQED